ncbi:SDR family oxidoreductase [Bdellovibrio bacteriovorus]|uniref:SDR family oxidoreductase n=1 Tax=Bdellovibrio bacteriovorus TaxID=959 RepID=UPI0035A5B20D
MTKPRILVTGGTGFLGKRVLPLLREKFEVDVLSRSGKTEVQGDLCQWNAGLDLDALRAKNYSVFLHMAGLYDLTAAKVDCYQHNISAMGTALKVAEALHIPFFVNTSTVAAGINSNLGVVRPHDLNFAKPFPDAYSESKAHGEQVLHNWPVEYTTGRINLRLGVLVGDTKTGAIERIDGPYHAAEAFNKIRAVVESIPTSLPLPGNEKTRLPLVPVDKCAEAIVKFCEWAEQTKPQGYQSFHVTPNQGLAIRDLYTSALKSQAIPHKGVVLVDKISEALILKISSFIARFPEEELHYLMNFPVYDTTATREILGETWCPEFFQYEQKFWSGYEAYVSNR